MKRRTFLARAGQAAAIASIPRASVVLAAPLAQSQEQTLRAVLGVLIPSGEDSPGAEDIHATEYLLTILTDPAVEESERRFITHGLSLFETFVAKEKLPQFSLLSPTEQERVMRAFTKEKKGESWLSTLLTYSLEALFGDPIYGGNREECGWKWIQHHPGFPRPPERKWYRNL